MQTQLKIVFIAAILAGLLAALLPTNIAWAGLLFQTVPTAGPSPSATAQSPSATPLPANPTATSAVVTQVPPSLPPQPTTLTPIPPAVTQLPTLAFSTEMPIPHPTLSSTRLPPLNPPTSKIETATTSFPTLQTSPPLNPTEIPGMVPTKSARTSAATPDELPVHPSFKGTASADPASGASAWVPILLAVLIVIGLALLGFLWKRKS